MHTVVELPSFVRDAKSRLTAEERESIISFIAYNPTVGDRIVGTRGVRKMRWGIGGRGKRGGVRVIYYYHDEKIPIFLSS